jgi:outer membrane cobalamin receptor
MVLRCLSLAKTARAAVPSNELKESKFGKTIPWLGVHMKMTLKVHAVFVFLLACCGAVFAQQASEEQTKKTKVELFEVVVVTAELDKPESATTISEVTADQIQQRNATNIGEALRLLPGVQLRVGRSKSEEQVTVRGFEQEKCLVLMDGIPISLPYEGQINLADIPVQNIASIKLIKGISSVLYGANGMGAVINVITRRGEPKPSFSVQYEGSQYAAHNIQVGQGWKKGPFSYYAAFSHREGNGYPLAGTFTLPQSILNNMASAPTNPTSIKNTPIPADEKSRDNSDYKRNALTFTGTIALGSKNTLGVSVEHYFNDYGVPPTLIVRENKGQKKLFYYPRYWRYTDWNRTTVNALEESRISEELTFKVRGFYDKYGNTLASYDNPSYTTQNLTSPFSGNTLWDDYDAGFSAYGYWKGIPGSELRFGLNFRRDVHESSTLLPPGGTTDNLSSDTVSVGLEDEIRIGKKFSMTPGASFDYLNKRIRYQSGTSQTPGKDVPAFNPQIGARYDASKRVSIYGSVGRKLRFPTMRNLYSDGVVGPLGNPDLKEESTINLETGTNIAVNSKVQLGGAYFYSRIKNMINFDNLIGRFEQYPKASITGVELSANGRIGEYTDALLSYTYMRSRSLDSVTITNQYVPNLVYRPDELPYRPAHQIDVEVRQRFTFGLEADLNGAYVSHATYYNHVDLSNNSAMAANKVKLGDYFLANARLTQKVKGGFALYFAIDNIANKQYQTLYLYPSQGRVYRWGLRAEI